MVSGASGHRGLHVRPRVERARSTGQGHVTTRPLAGLGVSVSGRTSRFHHVMDTSVGVRQIGCWWGGIYGYTITPDFTSATTIFCGNYTHVDFWRRSYRFCGDKFRILRSLEIRDLRLICFNSAPKQNKLYSAQYIVESVKTKKNGE